MPPMAFTPRRQVGFTLIELMIVIFVMAILIGLAVPSFKNTIRDNATNAVAGEFSTAVALAKSEAVKRGRSVVVCPRGSGNACGNNWANGWVVMYEEAGVAKGAAPAVAAANIVAEFGALSRNQLTLNGANQWIRFSSRGLLEAAADFAVLPKTGNCSDGALKKNMSLAIGGRIYVKDERVASC